MRRPQLRRRPARRLAARQTQRDVYAGMPVDELEEPILPRWFVLTLLASIPVAAVVFALAFFGFGRGQAPVAERRPPPSGELSSDVAELEVGGRQPVAHEPGCPAVDGFRVAGADEDRQRLSSSVDALCRVADEVGGFAEDLAAAGDGGTVVRYAGFEAAGVDVASDASTIYLDARHAGAAPELAAPLIAYEVALRTAGSIDAEAVVAAREAELAACGALLDEPSRPCREAASLLALDDPAAALREAGFD